MSPYDEYKTTCPKRSTTGKRGRDKWAELNDDDPRTIRNERRRGFGHVCERYKMHGGNINRFANNTSLIDLQAAVNVDLETGAITSASKSG